MRLYAVTTTPDGSATVRRLPCRTLSTRGLGGVAWYWCSCRPGVKVADPARVLHSGQRAAAVLAELATSTREENEVSEHEIVDGPIGPNVVCHAPAGAPCHRRCPNGTCEEWGSWECGCGPLVEVEACNAVDWFTAGGIEDCGPEDDPAFDLEGELVYRGPIKVEWNDGYVWERAEAAVSP